MFKFPHARFVRVLSPRLLWPGPYIHLSWSSSPVPDSLPHVGDQGMQALLKENGRLIAGYRSFSIV